MTKILDGKVFAKNLREELTQTVSALQKEYGEVPGLAVVLVGNTQPARCMFETKVFRQKNAECNPLSTSYHQRYNKRTYSK